MNDLLGLQIVVGWDGSDGAIDALGWARSFAKLHPGSTIQPVVVEVPHILETESPMLHGDRPSTIEHDANTALAKALADDTRSDDDDVQVLDVELLRGHSGRQLVERAAASDLLVVGSRGRGGIASALLGSVSSRCVATSSVPVVVVPETDGEWVVRADASIIAAVDGSLAADTAALWARTQFPQANVVLLKAWHSPNFYFGEPPVVPLVNYAPAAKMAFDRDVERIARQLPPGAQPFGESLMEGDARMVLTSTNADLLVLGSQEYHGLRRAILGSVAQSVLHHLTQPTVFVPATDTDE